MSHQGFSFLEGLCESIRELGTEPFVLSSRPSNETPDRESQVKALVPWAKFTSSAHLNWSDIETALHELERSGFEVSACISVWEGNRLLMAQANEYLGAVDESGASIQGLVDKLTLRSRLLDLDLSHAEARVVTSENLEALRKAAGRYFIKPRFGLGSFGAFPLTQATSLEDLTRVKRDMETDELYSGVFQKKELIAENYIEGREYSFEVMVSRGRSYVIGVHEKLEIDEEGPAVLEKVCVSPPVELTIAETKKGIQFIKTCLQALSVNEGCYHVEARRSDSTERWEIIEVNPRVGGSLINHSVKIQTKGCCLLKLWLKGLMHQSVEEELKKFELALTERMMSDEGTSTFFRVYYGEYGRKIASISERFLDRPPAIFQNFVKSGTRLPASGREFFLGQALWKMNRGSLLKNVKELIQFSNNAMEVIYET